MIMTIIIYYVVSTLQLSICLLFIYSYDGVGLTPNFILEPLWIVQFDNYVLTTTNSSRIGFGYSGKEFTLSEYWETRLFKRKSVAI